MNDFYKWCDDKLQVIAAVVFLSTLIIVYRPDLFNTDLVFGGLFGIGTGYALAKLEEQRNKTT